MNDQSLGARVMPEQHDQVDIQAVHEVAVDAESRSREHARSCLGDLRACQGMKA